MRAYIAGESHVPRSADLDDRKHGEMQPLLSHVPASAHLFPTAEYGALHIPEDQSTKARFLEFAVPYGVGEPLLESRIIRYDRLCTKAASPQNFKQKCDLLSEEYSRKLIEAGLSHITLHLKAQA